MAEDTNQAARDLYDKAFSEYEASSAKTSDERLTEALAEESKTQPEPDGKEARQESSGETEGSDETFGVDVSSLSDEQLKMVEQTRKDLVKGFHKKTREMAEERKEFQSVKTKYSKWDQFIGAMESSPDLLQRVFGALQPAAPVQAKDEIDALLDEVEDESKPLVQKILSVAQRKAQAHIEKVLQERVNPTMQQFQHDTVKSAMVQEQNQFLHKHPVVAKDPELYGDFQRFVKNEPTASSRSLDSLYAEYVGMKGSDDRTRNETRLDKMAQNAERRVETPTANRPSSKATARDLYSKIYDDYAKKGVV